ncbi:hypothetical protein ACFOHP_33635 [Couchioplanes caeruleus subsp. azureus]
MSDRWIHTQHNEIRDRNRRQRKATMQEAQRQADTRRTRRHGN